MKERPILFSTPMVCAILEGRKTITRRVVNPQPVSNGYHFDRASGEVLCHCDHLPPSMIVQPPHYDHPFLDQPENHCPYGVEGDHLWVRETWAEFPAPRDVIYRANFDPHLDRRVADALTWRPSIHMPRWASRITLAVKSVRVERLQEITEEDAKAEGVDFGRITNQATGEIDRDACEAFAVLWDAINGKRPGCSWSDNPWVWRIEFARLEAA